MLFQVITIFPGMFPGPLGFSIVGRALERDRIELRVHDLRDYTRDAHRQVDDRPYGGGAGMVMKPEPLARAVRQVRYLDRARVILLCPQGRPLDQALVRELAQEQELVLVCGHYEGVDERIRETVVTDEISVGDYVLTGGELPAMLLIEAVARLQPGVLGASSALEEESFTEPLLEYPQYTRPPVWEGHEVPRVLMQGNHEEIRRWRRYWSLNRTLLRRPDLLEKAELGAEDRALLDQAFREGAGS